MKTDSSHIAPAPAEAVAEGTAESNADDVGVSQQSDGSQTAAEFIRSQELLEADACEALPYSIESCTKILGPLRQNVFACLTCNPPPSTPGGPWTPAGVCYACSVQCHGEHTLVEIFQKRNFTCDCGTTRIPATSPCALRVNPQTNTKGNVHSEEPDANNKYNQNFRNRFCGCECDYDPFQQKGTMFQCLGLGTAETGGCGEDWYHPGCLVGMGPKWYEKMEEECKPKCEDAAPVNAPLATIAEDDRKDHVAAQGDANGAGDGEDDDDNDDDDPPMPPGFPDEESFEGFLCYKCVGSNPWVKQYAGNRGFLPAVMLEPPAPAPAQVEAAFPGSRKRKSEDDGDEDNTSDAKRVKGASETVADAPANGDGKGRVNGCKLSGLAPPLDGRFSLFFKEDFRDHLCRCSACYRAMAAHPQLLEEEEAYEPPLSDDAPSQHGGSTHGSGGSLLERGESALRNVDRVRAIEGVMAYNHLKEQLRPFFQQFAESGRAVGAEDVKAYFAKLRGDDQHISDARSAAAEASARRGPYGDGGGDARREQRGN